MKILYKPFLSCCPEAAVIYSISSNVTRNITSSEFEKNGENRKGETAEAVRQIPVGETEIFRKKI